jgi:hypothetical protein
MKKMYKKFTLLAGLLVFLHFRQALGRFVWFGTQQAVRMQFGYIGGII